MATATQKAIGFRVPCPFCGAAADSDNEGGLHVRLSDLTVRCPSCDEQVTRADLERMVADAQKLLKWLDAAGTF